MWLFAILHLILNTYLNDPLNAGRSRVEASENAAWSGTNCMSKRLIFWIRCLEKWIWCRTRDRANSPGPDAVPTHLCNFTLVSKHACVRARLEDYALRFPFSLLPGEKPQPGCSWILHGVYIYTASRPCDVLVGKRLHYHKEYVFIPLHKYYLL